MRHIDIKGGAVTLVSDADYGWLRELCAWRLHEANASKQPYVVGTVRGVTVYMHRIIANAPPTMKVDHKDGDGLHNCRPNLRIATHDQNNYNRRGFSLAGYKGVSREKSGRWRARLTYLENCYQLGMHATAEDAARAYDAKAFECFGEFAWLNFPHEWPSTVDVPLDPATEIPFP